MLLDLICKRCEKSFKAKSSEVARGQHKFCSRECAALDKTGVPRSPEVCAKISLGNTGKVMSAESRQLMSEKAIGRKYPTRIKQGQHLSPDTEFKPGLIPHNVCSPDHTYTDKSGYKIIRDPNGLYGRKSVWRREHIVIAEKALGRPLKKGECVHHINGDRLDNRNENLLICDNAYHRWLHGEMSRRYQKEHFGAAPITVGT